MAFIFQSRLSQPESQHIGSFLSSATSQWEMALPDCAGRMTFTLHGPATKAPRLDIPAAFRVLEAADIYIRVRSVTCSAILAGEQMYSAKTWMPPSDSFEAVSARFSGLRTVPAPVPQAQVSRGLQPPGGYGNELPNAFIFKSRYSTIHS